MVCKWTRLSQCWRLVDDAANTNDSGSGWIKLYDDGDMGAAITVVSGREELSGLQHALGGTIAVAAVVHDQFSDNLLHPTWNPFTLGYGVSDVFQVYVNSHRLKLVHDMHYIADFVR